jgi:hypothetical protein
MTDAPETLERELLTDLLALGDRFADREFSSELYRALANNRWRKPTTTEGAVSLSWSRAEELVNELRAGQGEELLALAQTGGEGSVSDTVAGELGRLGWRHEPLSTDRHDERHLSSPESPPPKGTGEHHAPVDDPRAWEREAHEEASERETAASSEPGETGARGRT